MSLIVENGIVHHPDRREITQLVEFPDNDSGQGDETPPRPDNTSSEDSSEEQTSQADLNQPSVGTSKKRNKFKVRSISDCCEDDDLGPAHPVHYRGILKCSSSRLRSLSESCADNYSLPNHGESMSALDECWYEEDDDDDEGSDSPKVKKTVRFSDTVHKQLFRSNSSILGQRKKNQRKRNKAKKSNAAKSGSVSSTPPTSGNHALSSSTESESAGFAPEDLSDALDSVTLSDSGIDASDSDPCPGSGVKSSSCNSSSNSRAKQNKKQKKALSRQRRASESSHSGDMIFDLDL